MITASIGLLVISLFRVGSIKIGEATIAVDRQVLEWYSAFLLAVLAAFLLRAYLDLKRAALARRKDFNILSAPQDLINQAWAHRNLQRFYWLELFHQIGERYSAYEKARSTNDSNKQPFIQTDLRVLQIDIDSLRKIPEFRDEIISHESFIQSILEDLDKDVRRFNEKVQDYDVPFPLRSASYGNEDWERYQEITKLFEKHLKLWFDARNNLSSAALDKVLDGKETLTEQKKVEAQVELLKEAVEIRRL